MRSSTARTRTSCVGSAGWRRWESREKGGYGHTVDHLSSVNFGLPLHDFTSISSSRHMGVSSRYVAVRLALRTRLFFWKGSIMAPETEFTTAAVIGAGMMGPGIALTLALGGIRVSIIDLTLRDATAGLEKARAQAHVLLTNELAESA